MIEIDKTDFLYKHLQKLGAENIEKLYLEYANNGVSNAKDFKKYIYSKHTETVDKEIDEEDLEQVLDYYSDIKKQKKLSATELKKALKDYKQNPDNKTRDLIVGAKLKDILFIACLYKMKFKDVELLDIVQVCNLGLLKAIDKYDEKNKLSFENYIDFWIEQEIENTFTKENENG